MTNMKHYKYCQNQNTYPQLHEQGQLFNKLIVDLIIPASNVNCSLVRKPESIISTMRFSTVRRNTVDAVKAYFYRSWNWTVIRSFSEVPPLKLRVLRLFYVLLSVACTSSAFGSYLMLTGMIGLSFATSGYCVCFISLIFFREVEQKKIRVFIFITGAFFDGALLSPSYAWFLGIDHGCTVSVLVGASVGFSCFWAASMWARHFDIFYLSGVCLSTSVVLLWIFAASFVFGIDSDLRIYLIYAVIQLVMVYVAMYSQELVHKICRGDIDYAHLAFTFLTDAPAVCFHCGRLVFTDVSRKLVKWNLHRFVRWQRANKTPSNSSLCLFS